MGGLLGGMGQRAAATPVGQFVSNVRTQGLGPALGQFAEKAGQRTGLTNIGQGVVGLFGGGDGQPAAPEYTPSPYAVPFQAAEGPAPDYTIPSPYAVPFQAAEGPVPGDVSLFVPEAPAPVAAPGGFVGPPSPVKPPNFLEGFWRGLTGQDLAGGADVLPPGAQAAGGVGELLAFLDQVRKQSSGQMARPQALPPIVQLGAGGAMRPMQLLPGYTQAQAPGGGLIHNLISSYSFGLLGGQIPSTQQVA